MGDRISRNSGNDVRVKGLATADILACFVCELLDQSTAVFGSFAAIELLGSHSHYQNRAPEAVLVSAAFGGCQEGFQLFGGQFAELAT